MPFILRYPLVEQPVTVLSYCILNDLYGWI
jgi:hypothetical protein